jgi:hypothetical protein
MGKRRAFRIGGQTIRAGTTRDIRLKISETYTGDPVELPIRVIRARRPGPRVFLTAALHGDEINGTGIIRELMFREPPRLINGTLLCAPVLNPFGFENHDRYMLDRRDLNRCFPGSPTGSLASRIADRIFSDIVRQCDYGIDFHTAAVHRTNFPNVRGDLNNANVRVLARSFGCELIIDGKGPVGSLRRAACDAGCPTIILEAGEVSKMEPTVLEIGLRGVRNVLIELGMTRGQSRWPCYQTTVRKTAWVRAQLGGLLRFHVAPGDIVEGGQPLATNESVFGEAQLVLLAPQDGVVLSVTTHPAVQPGEPVCHIALPRRSLRAIRRAIEQTPPDDLYNRLRADLGASMSVTTLSADPIVVTR